MKRYLVPKSLRKVLYLNRSILYSSQLGTRVKNLIYRNKSISEYDVNSICTVLSLKKDSLNLKKFHFNYENNFGLPAENITFAGASDKFAEFMGIMLGDGNFTGNMIRITMDSRDEGYRNYVGKLFFDIFNCTFHGYKVQAKNVFVLYKSNAKIAAILLKHGLRRGNKIKLRIRIPSWIKKRKSFLASCLRGLMDTDGTVSFDKRDRKILLGFCSYSPPLLSDVGKSLSPFQVFTAKGGAHQLRINRSQSIYNYRRFIGFSNPKHITRYDEFIKKPKLS